MIRLLLGAALIGVVGFDAARATTLREAVELAVRNHPAVEAAQANRRATGYELLQAEGRRLPRLDLDADVGREKIDRPHGFLVEDNDKWRTRRQGSLTLSQVVFDGWDRANDIYRNAAKVDSATYRLLARGEATALEAIEVFIDARRQQRILGLARDNVQSHRRILARVREQVAAGKTPESDIAQVRERIAAAEAVVERIRRSLLEADAQYFKVIGVRPVNLQPVGYPPGIPATRAIAVQTGVARNPLIGAADADTDVARFTLEQAKSSDYPTVSLEAKGLTGYDLGGTPGRDREALARVVVRWALFDGMIGRNKQFEFVERLNQARAERDERVRTVTAEIERAVVGYQVGRGRVEALRRQLAAAREVVSNYETEYTLGRRSLLDLLNAENSKFNVQIETSSEEAIHIFAAYRVLATMGGILEVLGITPPDARADARPAAGRHLDWRGVVTKAPN